MALWWERLIFDQGNTKQWMSLLRKNLLTSFGLVWMKPVPVSTAPNLSPPSVSDIRAGCAALASAFLRVESWSIEPNGSFYRWQMEKSNVRWPMVDPFDIPR
jgi:hypothetical protein